MVWLEGKKCQWKAFSTVAVSLAPRALSVRIALPLFSFWCLVCAFASNAAMRVCALECRCYQHNEYHLKWKWDEAVAFLVAGRRWACSCAAVRFGAYVLVLNEAFVCVSGWAHITVLFSTLKRTSLWSAFYNGFQNSLPNVVSGLACMCAPKALSIHRNQHNAWHCVI